MSAAAAPVLTSSARRRQPQDLTMSESDLRGCTMNGLVSRITRRGARTRKQLPALERLRSSGRARRLVRRRGRCYDRCCSCREAKVRGPILFVPKRSWQSSTPFTYEISATYVIDRQGTIRSSCRARSESSRRGFDRSQRASARRLALSSSPPPVLPPPGSCRWSPRVAFADRRSDAPHRAPADQVSLHGPGSALRHCRCGSRFGRVGLALPTIAVLGYSMKTLPPDPARFLARAEHGDRRRTDVRSNCSSGSHRRRAHGRRNRASFSSCLSM